MATDWSHQRRRAYSFAYRLAKKDAEISPTDTRGTCQLSEDGEHHCGVSHIYRCGNRNTIGQHAYPQRDLQFVSFLLLNSLVCGVRILIAYEFRLKYVRCRFCRYRIAEDYHVWYDGPFAG